MYNVIPGDDREKMSISFLTFPNTKTLPRMLSSVNEYLLHIGNGGYLKDTEILHE